MATAGFFLRCYAAYSFTIFTWFHRTSYALVPFFFPHFSSHRLIISLTGCLLPLFIFIFFFVSDEHSLFLLLLFCTWLSSLVTTVWSGAVHWHCRKVVANYRRNAPPTRNYLVHRLQRTNEVDVHRTRDSHWIPSVCVCVRVCGVVWCGYAMPFKRPSIVPTTPKLRNSNLFSIKSYQTTASMCTQLLSYSLPFFSMVQTWSKQEKKLGNWQVSNW